MLRNSKFYTKRLSSIIILTFFVVVWLFPAFFIHPRGVELFVGISKGGID